MSEAIVKHFERMGARVKVGVRGWDVGDSVRLNVLNDTWGRPYFSIQRRAHTDLKILSVEPKRRHLLLQATTRRGTKSKFLCGHDERAWFVAAIPEAARGVTNVASAMEALKPPLVREAQQKVRLGVKGRRTRRNKAYIRQGEWFFIPAPDLVLPAAAIINKNQPIRRGRGKPHMVEEEYRRGGDVVYVNSRYPNGVSMADRNRIDESRKAAQPYFSPPLQWTQMTRNGTVFVRGKVRHKDHATINLQGWHKVEMNTETQSEAMRHVAFLD